MRQCRTSSRHSAFTIVELIVSISIIAVLVAVTLPAVQQAREAARRVQCVSHLKQIGLAIHNYEATHGCVPLHVWDGSFLVSILPHIDQATLLEKYDSVPYRNGLSSHLIPLFHCPSDSGAADIAVATNSVGNFGYGYQRYGFNGVFGNRFSPVRFAEITDGLSNVSAVSECLSDGDDLRSRIYQTPYRLTDPDQLESFMHLCRQSAGLNGVSTSVRGRFWSQPIPQSSYDHTLYPNDVSCSNHDLYMSGAMSASSQHPGGVNVLYVDGHVSFVATSIDLDVWRSMGDRQGDGHSVHLNGVAW